MSKLSKSHEESIATEPLAISGGRPVRSDPWPPWPAYEEVEIKAATGALRSGQVNYWTGQEGLTLEKEFAAHCGVRHAVALMNGTVALDLAMMALGIGEGAEVIVTPRSFIASVSSVVTVGARPVFADVDPDSGNITAESVRKVLSPRTRAVLAVHLGGWPCEMDQLIELGKEHDLAVIEDCAQAHGATYKGRPVGGMGRIGAFSFCQDKIITTGGEGGILVTDDEEVWRRAWSFKDHGKSFDAAFDRDHPPGFRWLHESFGTNWRMTEFQAAIGRIQLKRLPETTAARRRNTAILIEGLQDLKALRIPYPGEELGHACYKIHGFLQPELLAEGWDRQRVMEAIHAEGVPCQSGICGEIYREKAFDGTGFRPAEPLPVALELGETSLIFLVHPTVTEADMRDTVAAVRKVLGVASR